jgi:hypothetical protein
MKNLFKKIFKKHTTESKLYKITFEDGEVLITSWLGRGEGGLDCYDDSGVVSIEEI